MSFTTYIAKRFLLGGRGAGTSRLTGWIAIIGLAVGCFAMVISVSVLNGFEERVARRIIGFEGDLRLSGFQTQAAVRNTEVELQGHPAIRMVMPFMERKGLISTPGGGSQLVSMKAVRLEKITDFYDLRLETLIDIGFKERIVIGRILADRMALQEGDRVKLMSPIDHGGFIGLPPAVEAVVVGIFNAGVLDYDDRLVFIPLELGNLLFSRKSGIDGLDLRLVDPDQGQELKAQLETGQLSVQTWGDIHEGLFAAMRLERLGAILVLSLIILVAAFDLTSTLVLVTVQKRREIGILRTLGITGKDVRAILLKQGLMIGGSGAMAGLSVSLFLVLVQTRTGFIPLPEDIYFIDQVPMLLNWGDVLLIPAIAFLLISLASLAAANRAAGILPREAIQWEK